MSENKESSEKFHEYDGIIEHDNPLPTWWLWSFFITIIFAFLYYVHYELGGGGLTLTEELRVSMQELEKSKAQNVAVAPLETEESLAEEFNRADFAALGAAQFSSKCAACHGTELQGSIGPNLTDKFWIHGQGTRLDILKVIREGIPEKGMPPWGTAMKRNEIYAVTAYILNKKNTQPAGAKEPQGEAVEDYFK